MTNDNLSAVQDRLKRILLEVVQGEIDADRIGPHTALMQGGVSLDSVAALEFVVRIEGEFDILLGDQTLTAADFESLATLARVVHAELSKQKPISGH